VPIDPVDPARATRVALMTPQGTEPGVRTS
jgi:hypothetical protein